jgi:hypothetical protein
MTQKRTNNKQWQGQMEKRNANNRTTKWDKMKCKWEEIIYNVYDKQKQGTQSTKGNLMTQEEYLEQQTMTWWCI